MNRGRILVASNIAEARWELRCALEFEGHPVAEVETTDQTVAEACSGEHDLLLLDSRMHGAVAFQLCRAIRPQSDLGIIVINGEARQAPIDVLNAGADDYVPMPLVLAELLARVRAILRRVTCNGMNESQIFLQDRAIDLKSHKIRGPIGREVHLTPKEFSVLERLVVHANQPLAHRNLAQAVWQRDGQGEVEYLRFVIKQLRRKLGPDPSRPRYILTERSVGYRFQMHPVDARACSRRREVKSAPRLHSAHQSDNLAMVR